jgi:hypothetical protein
MSIDKLVRLLAGLVVCAVCLLAPMQSDTWWQLRTGAEILAHGAVPRTDIFSIAAYGRPWPNHEWLAQVLFVLAWRAGGPPLLTLAAGLAAAAGILPSLMLLRGAWIVWLPLFLAALPAIGCEVAVRPQVFTLFAFGTTLALLARMRVPWPLPLLFALWANLHGGVVLGGLLLVIACGVAALGDRGRLPGLAVVTGLSGLATLLTPLGTRILTFPFESLRRLQTLGVAEWRHVGLDLPGITLAGCSIALVVLAVARRHRLDRWADRLLLGGALGFLVPAALASRNAPFFLLLAVPAVARLLAPAVALPRDPADKPRLNLGIATIAVLAVVLEVAGLYHAPPPRLGWRPVPPAALAALADAPDPLFTTYDTGGYVLWFLPDRPVFLDSRQDPYPMDLLQEAAAAERQGRPHPLFDPWGFRSAFVYTASPLGGALLAEGWTLAYQDADWRVLVSPGAALADADSVPAPGSP